MLVLHAFGGTDDVAVQQKQPERQSAWELAISHDTAAVPHLNVQLPVCYLHRLIIAEGVLTHLACLKAQKRPSEVPVRDLSNTLTERCRQLQAFFLGYIGQHLLNLRIARGCHSDTKASAPHWLNDLQAAIYNG